MIKNLFSVLCVIIFLILAVSSSSSKHLLIVQYGRFNPLLPKEEDSTPGNYIIKNDGSRVYGKRIDAKIGVLNSKEVIVDRQRFKTSEVRYMKVPEGVFGRYKNEFVERIIHGKINIYVKKDRYSQYGNVQQQFIQFGDEGDLILLESATDIANAVKSCPLAFKMINIGAAGVHKAIKENENFLNEVVGIYNNNCLQLK